MWFRGASINVPRTIYMRIVCRFRSEGKIMRHVDLSPRIRLSFKSFVSLRESSANIVCSVLVHHSTNFLFPSCSLDFPHCGCGIRDRDPCCPVIPLSAFVEFASSEYFCERIDDICQQWYRYVTTIDSIYTHDECRSWFIRRCRCFSIVSFRLKGIYENKWRGK